MFDWDVQFLAIPLCGNLLEIVQLIYARCERVIRTKIEQAHSFGEAFIVLTLSLPLPNFACRLGTLHRWTSSNPSFPLHLQTPRTSYLKLPQIDILLQINKTVQKRVLRSRVKQRIELSNRGARMNEIRGCGSRRNLFRLSHLPEFYTSEATRFRFLSTRTTTTTTTTTSTRLAIWRSQKRNIGMMAGTQTKWTASAVRKQFLDFFEGKRHTVGTWWG